MTVDRFEVHYRHVGPVFDGTRAECAEHIRRHGLTSAVAIVPARFDAPEPERLAVYTDHGNGD